MCDVTMKRANEKNEWKERMERANGKSEPNRFLTNEKSTYKAAMAFHTMRFHNPV